MWPFVRRFGYRISHPDRTVDSNADVAALQDMIEGLGLLSSDKRSPHGMQILTQQGDQREKRIQKLGHVTRR